MAVRRATIAAVAAAALAAVAVPAWLLRPPPVRVASASPPIAPVAVGDVGALLARDPFTRAGEDGEASPPPADAPELLGVAGRIGRDAVALARSADGATRTLSPGDVVDGWALEAVEADGAVFVRGGTRTRVALQVGE